VRKSRRWNAYKIARDWLRRFKNTRIEILTVYFLLMRAMRTRKIQFEKENAKIRCLWIQLNFIQGLIEFMEGFDGKKIDFFKSI
jgi:hypothetical protein